jgi:hypothetical protein
MNDSNFHWIPDRIEFVLTWDSINQIATMSYPGVKNQANPNTINLNNIPNFVFEIEFTGISPNYEFLWIEYTLGDSATAPFKSY